MQRVKKQAEQYLDKQRRTKRWHKVVTALAGIVVFCTTYALILPAVTMTTPLQCGTEEHTHTDECYITELVTPEPRLVCELEETEPHTHDESCYEVSTIIACGLEECEPHAHDESCYVDGELACGLEETEGHVHTNDCLENEFTLICGKEETEGHTHTDECFVTDEPQEQRTLTCEKVEHTHDDNCYLALELEPAVKYYCGFDTEHTHDESCYFENGELKCNIPEHTHTDECTVEPLLPVEPIALDDSFSAESDDGAVIVEIHVTGEAALPDGAQISEDALPQLTVTASEDDEAYDEYAAIAAEEGEVMMVAALEYKLTLDGYELDLSACEVTVSVTPTEAFQAILDAPQEAGLMMVTADAAADVDAMSDADITLDTTDTTTVSDTTDTTDDTIESDEDAVVERYNFSYYTVAANGVGYAVTRGANPSFTVQYYAYLNRVKTTGGEGAALKVIDTSGKNLPTNGTEKAARNIYVTNNEIETKSELTEIYKEEHFQYLDAPGLLFVNIVASATDNFTLKEIQVDYPDDAVGEDGEKLQDRVVTYRNEVRLTNRWETWKDNQDDYIYVTDYVVIKLIYDPADHTKDVSVKVYDYDISNGSGTGTTSSRTNINEKGINQSDNYKKNGGVKFGFGNTLPTGRQGLKWYYEKDKYATLNQGNGDNKNNPNHNRDNVDFAGSFKGTLSTFGLAKGIDFSEMGDFKGEPDERPVPTLLFADGVDAPNLFGGAANGKYAVTGLDTLKFIQEGDTYTLSAITGPSKKGRSNLQQLENPGTHTSIWTNNFFPLDDLEKSDGIGNDFKTGGDTKYHQGGSFNASDNGVEHNNFFGMTFAVEFSLTKSYIGPLEYYFFGDDDMWVFLVDKDDRSNQQLVCDIGGVHMSVGEFVNLWDYIDPDKVFYDESGNEKHGEQKKDAYGNLVFDKDGKPVYEDYVKNYELYFFYTERGASGSTCWMQFTLPTVVGLNLEDYVKNLVDETHGALWIEKQVSGIDTNEPFRFTLDLGADATDKYLANFISRDASGQTTKSERTIEQGSVIELAENEAMIIYNLPKDTPYKITEVAETKVGFHTEVTTTKIYSPDGVGTEEVIGTEQTDVASGMIEGNTTYKVVFTNTSSYELPATGGSGTAPWYTMGGVLLIAAVYLMYKKRQWLFGEGDSV